MRYREVSSINMLQTFDPPQLIGALNQDNLSMVSCFKFTEHSVDSSIT